MGLTTQERARLGTRWRELACDCLGVSGNAAAADVERLKRWASDATSWASPLEDQADAFALFALARAAVSFARCTSDKRRSLRGPALFALSTLALELLGDPPTPSPPTLPFRADLDG